MATEIVCVPDIGADSAEVIEICVKPGDVIAAEQSLVVLESDKASMELPSPVAGRVVEIRAALGASLKQGDAVLVVELEGQAAAPAAPAAPAPAPAAEAPAAAAAAAAPAAPAPAAAASQRQQVCVPDIGGGSAEVIEVCVAPGDTLEAEQSIAVLESDKASMEVPVPVAGRVVSVQVKVGDKVGGQPAAGAGSGGCPGRRRRGTAARRCGCCAGGCCCRCARTGASGSGSCGRACGGRRRARRPRGAQAAREFGVDLARVPGSGPNRRVLKEDVQSFVKAALAQGGAPQAQPGSCGSGIPPVPAVDFSRFGPVDVQPMSKLHKVTSANMTRSWLNVPHVTQFDDADITDLEDFRAALKAEQERRGIKLSPVPFILKACALALRANPKVNASLGADGETMVYKQYVHIGMAVDTPAGLMVPVIRDVDKKGIWELAQEVAELAQKAKERKLRPDEMQGACFTVSSLGNIGGQGFTPVVNAPEVAILGVSKLAVKPGWDGVQFVPRKMLPLSLSYDHRAVNGGDAGRFMTMIVELLGDVRRLAL